MESQLGSCWEYKLIRNAKTSLEYIGNVVRVNSGFYTLLLL